MLGRKGTESNTAINRGLLTGILPWGQPPFAAHAPFLLPHHEKRILPFVWDFECFWDLECGRLASMARRVE